MFKCNFCFAISEKNLFLGQACICYNCWDIVKDIGELDCSVILSKIECSILSLIFFLEKDLSHTRELLKDQKITEYLKNCLMKKKKMIDSIKVECFDVSIKYKNRLTSILLEHKALLNLYI